MKKVILGILIGALAVTVFVLYGGGGYVRKFGRETESAGTRIEKFEKQMRKSVKGVGKTVDRAADRVKELVDRD